MVVTESAYTEWLSSLDPLLAEKVERSVVRVKGSDLPAEIVVDDTGGRTADLDPESEYIIMAAIWCYVCGVFVSALIGWALGKWVFDPFHEWIVMQWEKIQDRFCGHGSVTTIAEDTSTCPYRPWCLGTWQAVVWDNGTSAELVCECGGLWYHHNPLN